MKKNTLIYLIFLYLLIPIIILINRKLFTYKFYILTLVGIIIFAYLKYKKVKNEELGICTNNLKESLKRNAIIIIISIITIIILRIFSFNKFIPTETIMFYLFYIFISCPLQEFLYRGVFYYYENTFKMNSKIMLILSSFCYSFVHIIYKDILTCVLTFIIGLIWYEFYRKDKNLFGVSLSHSIIGILTIYLGIVN